jgi:type II secretory pathway pseudopilin PulG
LKMLRSIKLLICPSRSSSTGFALLIVMVAAAVLLISLTAVLPSIHQEGQREREAELIFRGYQYARAIAGYHQKFQRYPNSIQDLTKLTNGFRFLRKEYADPMTPGGKWRFIHANAQGVLLDSKTQGPAPGAMGQGANPGAAGFGTSTGSGLGGFGQQGMGNSAFGQQAGSLGQQGMGGSSFGQPGSGNSSFGAQGASGSGFGQSAGGFSSDSNLGGSTPNSQSNSGFSMGSGQGGGTFIVGVASQSHKPSIRIWNQKTHYDEWEFLGVDLGALGIATSIAGLPQGAGTQSGQGNQPSGFGQGNQPSGFGQGNQPSGFGQSNPSPGQNQSGFPSSGGSATSGTGFSPQ